MSVPARRALLTAGPLALSLALALPGAAAADPGAGTGSGGGRAEASPSAAPASRPTTAQRPAQRPAEQPAEQAARPAPRRSSAARPAQPASGARPAAEGRPAEPRPAEGRPAEGRPAPQRPAGAQGGDPRGNNGTIKIDGVPLGDGRGTEPHVDCAFAVDFWGFDAGQTADLVFSGQAPTGGGVLLQRSGVPVSDDAAGGGQDRDASLLFTAAQLGLDGPAPHRNGWHVKVAVDVVEAPGGAKQKVFWLQCPAPAASPTSVPTSAPAQGGATAAGTTAAGTTAGGATTTGSGVAGASLTGAGVTAVLPAAGEGATARQARGQAGEARVVAASRGGRLLGGAALPFTGGELGLALLLGAGAVGAGVLTLLAARRRGVAL